MMNVLALSLIRFCASSSSSPGCEWDLALLQLNSRESSVSLSPTERIGPNIHRHKLAFSEANATVSTTEPTYREVAGYWPGGSDASALSDSHSWPPTPSEAKAMLKTDPRILGYSYQKSHPDVAYVKTAARGAPFVPSEDWVSVLRADDYWAKPSALASVPANIRTAKQVALAAAKSRTRATAAHSAKDDGDEEKVFNWENPPPDYHPLKAEGDESVEVDGRETAEPEPTEPPVGVGTVEPTAPAVTEPYEIANETDQRGSFAPAAAVCFIAALYA
jgi:hypothetical protein